MDHVRFEWQAANGYTERTILRMARNDIGQGSVLGPVLFVVLLNDLP